MAFPAAAAVGSDVQLTQDDHAADGRVLSAAETHDEMARMAAESFGIPQSVASQAIRHQQTMDSIQSAIRALNPDGYGGAVHADLPDIGTTVYVAAADVEAARLLVADQENVSIAVASHSLEDLIEGHVAAAEALVARGMDVDDFITQVDVALGSVVVRLVDTTPAIEDLTRELESAAGVSIVARVVSAEELRHVETHTYGGGQLRDDGADECTSGFTVRKNGTSVDGVLTAAHCSGLNQYREPTGLVYSMSYQAAANPGWGDVEWHTTTHTEYDDFYYSKLHNSRIDVTGMLQSWQFDYGDIVCAFGRVSGAMGCDTINGLWYSGSGYSYLVSTTPCGTVPGDSGGPRYLNGTAIGIGRGFFKSDGSCTLSSLAYTLPDLGLTLKS